MLGANHLSQNQPIGVFDSGIGGLTIVRAIREALPAEDIIYFGDTAHLPYGDKSPTVLQGYVHQIVAFLISQNVKAIVIACNTAASAAHAEVVDQCNNAEIPIPVIEVITPTVKTALRMSTENTKPGHVPRIGIIGTKTTVQSHVYQHTLLALHPGASVLEKATPLLVPMIEEGWADNNITHEVIEAYLSDTGFTHLDTLILGCTHYPLIRNNVQQYFDENAGHKVHVIDSSVSTAMALKETLAARNLLRTGDQPGKQIFYVSDLTEGFQATARIFFGQDLQLQKHIWPATL